METKEKKTISKANKYYYQWLLSIIIMIIDQLYFSTQIAVPVYYHPKLNTFLISALSLYHHIIYIIMIPYHIIYHHIITANFWSFAFNA